MVSINLAPQSVVAAKKRYRSAEWIVALTISVLLLVVTTIVSLGIESYLSRSELDQEEILATQLQALSEQLRLGQKQVKFLQARSLISDSLTESRLRVSSGLKFIAETISSRISLISVRITADQIHLAGVASSRAVVGDIVNALKAKARESEVVIGSLKEVSIDRYILEEFEVSVSEATNKPVGHDEVRDK